jgi:hypothetical protein
LWQVAKAIHEVENNGVVAWHHSINKKPLASFVSPFDLDMVIVANEERHIIRQEITLQLNEHAEHAALLHFKGVSH